MPIFTVGAAGTTSSSYEIANSLRFDSASSDNIVRTKLKNISSIALGGSDLKNIYLGCLLGKQIATCKSKIPGLEPSHWKTKTILNKEFLNI